MGKPIVQKVSVGVCMARDGKVLLIRRSANDSFMSGLWEFPGGKREAGEPSAAAAAREAKEETGLDVEIGQPFFVFDYRVEKPEEIRDVTMIVFAARPENSAEVRLSAEHDAFAWVGSDEMEKHNASAETKQAMRNFWRMR
ncbi:MAG: NUDIX hydrolase [Patescibacteria group bacterium]|nr:NUDIX hydrolase [Patescibacteria group bacterium]